MVVKIENKSKTIGLTGPRMGGKDIISKKFIEFGVPVFDADTAFKFIINYDEDVRKSIRSFFGDNAFNAHFLNWSFFDTDPKVRKLMELAEERVFDTFFKWRSKQKTNYVIFMFAGIYEMLNLNNFHSIINVTAPTKLRAKRIRQNFGEDMDHILEGEYPPTIKTKKSDYNIYNYDGLSVARQVNSIHQQICENI